MNILAHLRSRLATALASFTDDPDTFAAMVGETQDQKLGDFQANCAMPLAGKLGKGRRELAGEIVEQLDVSDLFEDPEIAGPGFINLRLRDDRLTELVNDLVSDERLGVEKATNPRTIVVDYSAPNVAKPMHVGHLRSSVIGDALCRVLRFLGHKVIGDNHIGDWGTQFGMIIYGYKHFRDDAALQRDSVEELARLYKLVSKLSGYHSTKAGFPQKDQQLAQKQHELETAEENADPKDKKSRKALGKRKAECAELQAALKSDRELLADVESSPDLKPLIEAHPGIADQARRETAKLHAGDDENVALWNEFLPACLAAIDRMYKLLDITFDKALGESFYQPMLADVVDDLQGRGLASESEGAICVFNEGHAAPFIVRKSDGAFMYATTDLATIRYRVDEWQADRLLYVVDSRQDSHFEQLFATAERWIENPPQLRHVKFGTVLGEDKRPFKTRSGDTVGLESLINEAISRARTIVDENDEGKPNGPELDEATRADVAEAVGIGGIKYADLHHNRESDYVFSWDKMLAKTGDTATYIQYAYARVGGIFRRGHFEREAVRSSGKPIRLQQPAERALALQLCRFVEAIESVTNDDRPNLLTQYLFETANSFATFFEQCPVLKAEEDDVRDSRLLLCDLTARVLVKGLELLGIRACERM
jgi:arginyl-tRNA synthetase